MSTTKFVSSGYEIDATPNRQADGKFVACARLTRLSDHRSEEIWPDFEPFSTEAEAASAAHLSAVAWINHQTGGT